MAEKKLKLIWYNLSKWMCYIFCHLTFRIKVINRENIPSTGPVLVVCNHQSFLDPMLCGIHIPVKLRFMARSTLFTKNRLWGKILRSVGTIPVKRGETDIKAVKTVINKLREGKSVCLFPEATRTTDGRIAEFKAGLGLLCRRGKAPILPVVIDGAYECWPKGKKIFNPGKDITVCYGDIISQEQLKHKSDQQLASELTLILRQMQQHCRNSKG